MKTESFFMQSCLFLLIALSPIQDLFLQATPLRGIGGYPSMFPLLAILAVSLTRRLWLGNFNVNRRLLLCLTYIVAVTVYGFLFFGTTSHGENLFLKTATSSAGIAFFFFAMYSVDYEPLPTVRAAFLRPFVFSLQGSFSAMPTHWGCQVSWRIRYSTLTNQTQTDLVGYPLNRASSRLR